MCPQSPLIIFFLALWTPQSLGHVELWRCLPTAMMSYEFAAGACFSSWVHRAMDQVLLKPVMVMLPRNTRVALWIDVGRMMTFYFYFLWLWTTPPSSAASSGWTVFYLDHVSGSSFLPLLFRKENPIRTPPQCGKLRTLLVWTSRRPLNIRCMF